MDWYNVYLEKIKKSGGNNKAKFINKSIFELDNPKNSFDLCFSCGV